MKPRLALRAAALVCAALATTACGKISVTSYLNVDQNAGPTQLTITGLGAAGGDVVIPVGGGLKGTITIDTTKLLSSPDGIMGTIVAKEITLGGLSEPLFGNPLFPSGTLCVRQDPANPTAGTILIALKGQSEAVVDFNAQATSVNGSLPLGVLQFAANEVDIPLTIDWSKLLTLNLNGAIKASMSISTDITLPALPGVVFPVQFDSNLISSTRAASDPIVTATATDCSSFWAGN